MGDIATLLNLSKVMYIIVIIAMVCGALLILSIATIPFISLVIENRRKKAYEEWRQNHKPNPVSTRCSNTQLEQRDGDINQATNTDYTEPWR